MQRRPRRGPWSSLRTSGHANHNPTFLNQKAPTAGRNQAKQSPQETACRPVASGGIRSRPAASRRIRRRPVAAASRRVRSRPAASRGVRRRPVASRGRWSRLAASLRVRRRPVASGRVRRPPVASACELEAHSRRKPKFVKQRFGRLPGGGVSLTVA